MVVVRRKVIKINKTNTVFFILFHLLCSYLHFNLFIYFDERDNVFIHDACAKEAIYLDQACFKIW